MLSRSTFRVEGGRSIAEIHEAHGRGCLTPGKHERFRYVVAGRVFARRDTAAESFWDICDETGILQLRRDTRDKHQAYASTRVYMGDIVCVEGVIFVTQLAHITLDVQSHRLLATGT
jgi:lysyl-tRNA synthetase class II